VEFFRICLKFPMIFLLTKAEKNIQQIFNKPIRWKEPGSIMKQRYFKGSLNDI